MMGPRIAPDPADLSILCIWPTCNLAPLEPPEMLLCQRHLLRAFRYCQQTMASATPEQLRQIPIHKIGMDMDDALRARISKAHSVVYYTALNGFIKIGTTVRLEQRINELGGNLIVTEPGGRELEVERHAQFAHLLRRGREYFHPGHELLAHVVGLQKRP